MDIMASIKNWLCPELAGMRASFVYYQDVASAADGRASRAAAEANSAKYELANTKAEIAKLSAEVNEIAKTASSAVTQQERMKRLLESIQPVLAAEANLAAAALKRTSKRSKSYKELDERSSFLDGLVIAVEEIVK